MHNRTMLVPLLLADEDGGSTYVVLSTATAARVVPPWASSHASRSRSNGSGNASQYQWHSGVSRGYASLRANQA